MVCLDINLFSSSCLYQQFPSKIKHSPPSCSWEMKVASWEKVLPLREVFPCFDCNPFNILFIITVCNSIVLNTLISGAKVMTHSQQSCFHLKTKEIDFNGLQSTLETPWSSVQLSVLQCMQTYLMRSESNAIIISHSLCESQSSYQ